jgi:hypothetical protein
VDEQLLRDQDYYFNEDGSPSFEREEGEAEEPSHQGGGSESSLGSEEIGAEEEAEYEEKVADLLAVPIPRDLLEAARRKSVMVDAPPRHMEFRASHILQIKSKRHSIYHQNTFQFL